MAELGFEYTPVLKPSSLFTLVNFFLRNQISNKKLFLSKKIQVRRHAFSGIFKFMCMCILLFHHEKLLII